MKSQYCLLVAALMGLVVSSCTTRKDDANSVQEQSGSEVEVVAEKLTIRFATFNTSFNRKTEGQLVADMETGTAIQIRRVAEVIQRVRPQVILLNEVDFDEAGKSVRLFQEKFLGVSQNKQDPINYPHIYFGPVNTGVDSGIDINQDGKVELPNDGFGFGAFPGQYGMVVLSQFPIDQDNVRTFRKFLWKDMPDAKRPVNPESSKPYYPNDVFDKMRLSSKSHWDVPIQIDGQTIHLICSHPTPPVFDGPEDRNGCRNHDEIRMVSDYVSNKADYLVDDNGITGGLATGAHFVVVGDLNADPVDGDSSGNAARQLTRNPAINHSVTPASKGAKVAGETSGGKNDEHRGDHAHDTGDFRDDSAGNVRIDYCLPSATLEIVDCGVFWPAEGDNTYDLNSASDHHLVWVDVAFD